MNRVNRVGLLLAVLVAPSVRADESVTISEAKTGDGGVLVHEARSPYQAKTTQLRVLLPNKVEKGKTYPVVYVLPDEAGTERRNGDGLKEVQKLDLHNKLNAVFVAPTFTHLPWYADHPTEPEIRQEGYLLKVVVPFVDKTYPVRADADGRLLLGFSKSGWGAWSLLLRNPDVFGRAAAWDAPLMTDGPGEYGSGDIFGTADSFEGYRVSKLLEAKADKLQKEKRLVLLGYGNFRAEHELAHARMDKLKVANEYRDGPDRKHDWHSGWAKEAAEMLLPPAADWPSWRGPTRDGLSPEPSGCLDWETGETVWEGGAFGDPGSCVVTADERVIVYGLGGRLALVETAARAGGKYVELAAREKLFRTQAWPHVALAGGRIYCRDRDGHLACFSVPPK